MALLFLKFLMQIAMFYSGNIEQIHFQLNYSFDHARTSLRIKFFFNSKRNLNPWSCDKENVHDQ